ncbi:hypothetical protein GCM10027610_014430 [Dactylosporangium cerinum]
MTALSWLIVCVRGFTAEARGEAEQAQDLDRSVGGFGGGRGPLGQYGVRGGDGVDGVGFAVAAAGGAVGAVDLDHGDVVAAQETGQCGAVGAGAFHAGTVQDAEATGPGQQLLVAGGSGREGGVGDVDAEGGDDRGDVDVFVRADAENHLVRVRVGLTGGVPGGVPGRARVGHPGHGVFVLPMARGADGHRWTGGAVRTVMVRLFAARPLSGHALPVR